MRIAGLYRYAVKSMDGESIDSAEILPAGIPGDRGWALYDRTNGKPLSAKRHGALMLCRARYAEPPRPGKAPPPAEIVLPDGTRTRSDEPAASELLSRFLGVACAFGRREDGAGHYDDRPLHLLTGSSLESMRAESGLDFDHRRFRANVLIEGAPTGRPEDGWLERELSLGALRVWTIKRVRRCVMTTLPQPELRAERGTVAALAPYEATIGIYAEAVRPGSVSIGDPVTLAPQKS